MKCRFDYGPVASGCLPAAERRVPCRPSAHGVALVITLVLLSIITFMAIAFLVLSQGERGAVTTSTDQAVARLGAEAGLEMAKSRLLAPMRAFNTPFSYGLAVSTNFINQQGFIQGSDWLTNVSYTYPNGNPVGGTEALRNLNNLQYDPRPPVYIQTLSNQVFVPEFRYYLDLNRNGRYDTNGFLPVMNPFGGYYDTNGLLMSQMVNGNTLSNFFVGDPEWVGGLEFPDRRHSGTNRFLYRYAYLVVPSGQTLDINAIHNFAKQPSANMARTVGDGFLRNQGVGPWEINLAAFLVDLNTNIWATNVAPYVYNWRAAGLEYQQPNRGVAFDDALFLLRYRYYDPYLNSIGQLASVANLFGNIGRNAFDRDMIDGYSAGPVLIGPWPGNDNDIGRTISRPWSGAENPGRLFTTQDFFDRARLAANVALAANEETFSDRLARAGRGTSSYDRYTFYRLLSQLGTDSEPEVGGKMNLNYDNLNIFGNQEVPSVTNFNPWIPVVFFTNAANRLLASAGYAFDVNNIQIYPTNNYTPNVHRLMQLAANLLDGTTNTPPNVYPKIPHVFRPFFERRGQEIYVRGYEEVVYANAITDPNSAPPIRDLNDDLDRQNVGNIDMVYGVPLIVGAKKGLPNFNEFSMQTHISAARLLEFRRPSLGAEVNETNQMYVIGISNVFGMEAWNSYSNAFPRAMELIAVADMTAVLTNEMNMVLQSNRVSAAKRIPINPAQWKGWTNYNEVQQSFAIPFHPSTNTFAFLRNSTYHQSSRTLIPQTHIFERQSGFATPRWWLKLNTRVRFILVDRSYNRILDYVSLNYNEETIDLMAKLAEEADCNTVSPTTYSNPGSQWCTNRPGGNNLAFNIPTYGILNQVGLGLNGSEDMRSFTLAPGVGRDAESAVDGFRYNLKGYSPKYPKNIGKAFYRSNIFYAPFAAHRPIYVHTSWQANDPLVHYTIGDLRDLQTTNNVQFIAQPLDNIGRVNTRYQPWGGGVGGSSTPTIGAREMGAKDPLVTRSDDWEFPTNKFPNIGWIGRVHRGTPWQTVYLKSDEVPVDRWLKWTGNPNLVQSAGQFDTNQFAYGAITNDAYFSHPMHDRKIVDLFTTAISDTASRGRLSINQTNLAAWSAVFSGVNVLPDGSTNMVISPAGPYDPTSPTPVAAMVQAINEVRRTKFNGSFKHLGDLAAVPELTVRSPFLSGNTNLMNDAVYERIPQQVLGLLHCDERPRFVVYSYGQTLKPAPNSVVTAGGPYFGMVTNYQVTAESAIRAVVRVENPTSNPRIVVESFNPLPPE